MRTPRRPLTVLLTALALAAAPAAPALAGGHDGHGDPGHRPPALRWQEQVLDADQGFRGLDAVDARTAWVTGGSATGKAGTVWRTVDAGRTWAQVGPPGADGLLLRDVEARSAREASVLAIGPGEASRIYRTTDGGRSWTETFRNTDPAAFYDCLAFFPGGRHGLAMSDPVDGRFRMAATDDGGRSWHVLPSTGMPDAAGEAGFAASGDCLVTSGHEAWFGSGGAASRIYHSRDLGRTWTATPSGIPAGDAAGVFGLAVRDHLAVAVGGDFADPADGTDAVSTSRDGRHWRSAGDLTHLGEDVAFLPRSRSALVVTGESGDVGGTSVSLDAGRSWTRVADTGFHTLDCTADGTCWAAGAGGRVARASLR